MDAIVAVGASLGGQAPLMQMLSELPRDLAAAVLVVVHVPPGSPGLMAQSLSRSSALPVTLAGHDETPRAGHVYVAPPDHHLELHDGRLDVNRGPTHNGSRPAVDPLFRSVAAERGSRAVGVVLSGLLDCGSAGLLAIRRGGGRAIVQDPDDATAPDMPLHAIELVPDAVRVTAANLAGAVVRACAAPKLPELVVQPETDLENLSCPDCGGPVQPEADGHTFSCRVGHAFSILGLDSKHGQALEGALWTAVRILEERRDLTDKMAMRARLLGNLRSATQFERRLDEFREKAKLLRDVLTSLPAPVDA